MAIAASSDGEVKKTRKGARKGATKPMPTELVVGLNDPGMTPLLRAGVGGLASALRALAREKPRPRWPCSVSLADGVALVEPQRIVLRFGPKGPEPVLEDLFSRVFRISGEGVISPLGIFDGTPPLGLAIALQKGWRRTFLQHFQFSKKAGANRVVQTEVDDQVFRHSMEVFSWYAHQDGPQHLMEALSEGFVILSGWVYPGAAQRHVGFNDTKCEYSAAQALAGMFALIGCLSLPVAPGSDGVLVVPVPDDLVAFAEIRPRLTPKKVSEIYVVGVGDAVLGLSMALKVSDVVDGRQGIRDASGMRLQTLPWGGKQKVRASTLDSGVVSDRRLDAYANIINVLPSRVRGAGREVDEGEQEHDGFFVATSAFRGFVTENLAQNRPWFTGFATTHTGGKRPRYIHYFRDHEGGLGALYPEEKRGIITMTEYLERAEQLLVTSVHIALRGRFAQIAEDTKDAPATMKNRFKGERERLRLAFAGAKTPDQIRSALADLWSRGGTNKGLQENWREVLPLLRPQRWQIARDLALVALASYQGTSRLEEDEDDTGDENHDDGNDGGR